MGFLDSVGSIAGTAWGGIKTAAIKTGEGAEDLGRGVVKTGEGAGEITAGVFTGDTGKIKRGAEKAGSGALNTIGGTFGVASGVIGGGVDTFIGTTNQALGEGFKAAGAKGVGDFLESDDFNRYSKLAGNLALLAVPGVGEAELASEARAGAELSGELSSAVKAASKADETLAEASQTVAEAEKAGESTQEINELRKAEEAAKSADTAAQSRVAEETKDLQKASEGKFPKIRKALRTKFVRMGLEGAALDKAIDDALHLLLVGGVISDKAKPKPKPPDNTNRNRAIFAAVLLIVIVILVILFTA